MKKAERGRHTSGAKMPRKRAARFSTCPRTRQSIASRKSPKNSLPFSVLFGAFCPSPHLRWAKMQNLRTFFGYSVVKYHQKCKRAATFPSSSRTFASPLLKQFLSSFNSLNFKFRERKRRRSRFSKSFCRDDLSRPFRADISDYQNSHTHLRTDFYPTASRRRSHLLSLYVSNFESL